MVSGDLESHAVYEYTQTVHAGMVKNISDTIRSYFPTIPVYFAIGNHEGVPIDKSEDFRDSKRMTFLALHLISPLSNIIWIGYTIRWHRIGKDGFHKINLKISNSQFIKLL